MSSTEIVNILVGQFVIGGLGVWGSWKLVNYKVAQALHANETNKALIDKLSDRLHDMELYHSDVKKDIAVMNKSVQNLEKDMGKLSDNVKELNGTMRDFLSAFAKTTEK